MWCGDGGGGGVCGPLCVVMRTTPTRMAQRTYAIVSSQRPLVRKKKERKSKKREGGLYWHVALFASTGTSPETEQRVELQISMER